MSTQYYTASSLDGYIADEHNSLDWLFAVEAERSFDETFGPFFADVGAVAMGATTYEWMLAHERLLADPDGWRRYFAEVPCWVFTHRALPLVRGADIRIAVGDVEPVHAAMAQAADVKNVWLVGGGDLVGQFLDRDLLDEIIVDIAPVTLGGGGAQLLPRRLLASQLELVQVSRNGQFARLNYRLRSKVVDESAR